MAKVLIIGAGGVGSVVAQRLLVEIDLTGATVSFDALHGQAPARETAMSGGESLVQIKGNQKTILASAKHRAAKPSPLLP